MIKQLGFITFTALTKLYNLVGFVMQTLSFSVYGTFYPNQFTKFLYRFGYHSILLVFFTSFFVGAVLVIQIYIGSDRLNAEFAVPYIVMVAVLRELSPVITALILTGRLTSSITSEITSMKLTHQLDSMALLGVNPLRFIAVPRVLACVVSVPLLTLLSNIIAILGSVVVASLYLNFNPASFIHSLYNSFFIEDCLSGLVKSVFFGLIVGLTGTYYGFSHQPKGSEHIGIITTKAVVAGSIFILFVNLALSQVLFGSSS